ncbi:hypothetical protein IU500_13425 [Nocardia terpenica]|uniref:hypothetical protein n=1 Tax=Nocardia terpenica TaxID=455432 RepID=UPI00189417B0|nr:hypothetical protein [Nocardia terpenica]MBF6062822.1 hypothetical protein [Nocardia terpenica]MBF6105043.1 hypothetical protein [Nocardia terpenica]MBF6112520.1 hypothetical protein [Nocardia terpenica]MBF6118771.1 hypothetical protein [Nocardia terpenica]MBF6154240.1 hypothetical protein [Nocardia terpenica]
MAMDNGRSAAAGLWQSAVNGTFRLEEDTAKELAVHYGWIASTLRDHRRNLRDLERLDGFGNLQSAIDLKSGFENKAVQGAKALQEAEEVAYRMQAAILRAAKLMGDVDAANSAAIGAANGDIDQ